MKTEGLAKGQEAIQFPENIFSVSEKFLAGKRGLIIDSPMMAKTFRMFIDEGWGGEFNSN